MTLPRLRPVMDALPAYVPGRKQPGAVVLASNESPYGLLPSVAARIGELTSGVSRYPDMSSTRLREAIASFHGVAVDRVAVGAGSVEVVGQLIAATVEAGDEVVFGWRAFEAYPIVVAVAGGTAVRVPLREEIHDLDAMAAAVTDRTRLVLLCNPNNPTGTAVGADELTRFVDAVPADVLVVVDEAYLHYADPAVVPDALALLGDRPNVAVTRTFSKAFGLAGLRVGYCVAPERVAAAVRKTQIPFSVNALAQECAIAALADSDEVSQRAALTVAERDRVGARLLDLGYEIPPSQANFVWASLPDPAGADAATSDHPDRATSLARWCAAKNVLVRPFAGEGVRITIGLPEENDLVLAAAESWDGRRR